MYAAGPKDTVLEYRTRAHNPAAVSWGAYQALKQEVWSIGLLPLSIYIFIYMNI